MQFVDVNCDKGGRPIHDISPTPKARNNVEPGGVNDYSFLDKFYILHETIGKGGFSIVRRATHVHTGEVVAIKMVDKRCKVNKESVVKAAIDQELQLLKSLDHPNICKIFQEIQTSDFICMVQEFYPGGELFHYVKSKERLNESESRRLFRQVTAGLAYLHENGVCHRDLKLENILLDSSLNAKLIDFGLCAVRTGNDDTPLSMFCGSPTYAAPELVTCQPYIGFKTDIWSLGVVVYCCLNGFFPFYSADYTELYALIQIGKYEEPEWLSEESKAIIRMLLQIDPEKRPTMKDVLECDWCREMAELPPSQEAAAQGKGCRQMFPDTHNLDINKSKMVGNTFNEDVITKMAEFYGSSNEALKNELGHRDFSSYVTSTYLILLERKRKYGSKLFKIFGVQIPKANASCSHNEFTTSYTVCLENKIKNNTKLDCAELGGGDICKKTEFSSANERKSCNLIQHTNTSSNPVVIIKCSDPTTNRNKDETKNTKNSSTTGPKLLSIVQLAHRISGAFGRNKNDVRDCFVTLPPRIIDPTVAMRILKAAMQLQGVKYTQNGLALNCAVFKINSASSKLECVGKFEVEVQVREVILKPLGTVQLSWRKLQGSTNFLRRVADVITSSMKTLTCEKLLYR